MTTELLAVTVFALGAGVATFFSPCAYALLPGYVGYYVATVDDVGSPLPGAILRGTTAALGAVGTFAVLSGVAVLASDLLAGFLPVLEPLVGVVVILLGLAILLDVGSGIHVPLPARRSGVLGFGLFGGLYALASTACVLPLFLAVAIQATTMPTAATVTVLGAFAGSFGLLMVGVTVATAVGYGVSAGRVAGHVGLLTKLAGVVLVLAGLGQLYVAFAL